MSDPAIKSMLKWWFRLITLGSLTAFLGVVVFIRTSIMAGVMTGSAYIYAGGVAVLMLLALVWLKSKVNGAPEMIEGFLRRLGLYRPS